MLHDRLKRPFGGWAQGLLGVPVRGYGFERLSCRLKVLGLLLSDDVRGVSRGMSLLRRGECLGRFCPDLFRLWNAPI